MNKIIKEIINGMKDQVPTAINGSWDIQSVLTNQIYSLDEADVISALKIDTDDTDIMCKPLYGEECIVIGIVVESTEEDEDGCCYTYNVGEYRFSSAEIAEIEENYKLFDDYISVEEETHEEATLEVVFSYGNHFIDGKKIRKVKNATINELSKLSQSNLEMVLKNAYESDLDSDAVCQIIDALKEELKRREA